MRWSHRAEWSEMAPRFTVRKVTKGWMVWDTVNRKVAEVDELPALGLSAETANRFAEMLNSQNEATNDHKTT
jgi:hypothetical protein